MGWEGHGRLHRTSRVTSTGTMKPYTHGSDLRLSTGQKQKYPGLGKTGVSSIMNASQLSPKMVLEAMP